jgi:uncharacterized protein involved in response to NO
MIKLSVSLTTIDLLLHLLGVGRLGGVVVSVLATKPKGRGF